MLESHTMCSQDSIHSFGIHDVDPVIDPSRVLDNDRRLGDPTRFQHFMLSLSRGTNAVDDETQPASSMALRARGLEPPVPDAWTKGGPWWQRIRPTYLEDIVFLFI